MRIFSFIINTLVTLLLSFSIANAQADGGIKPIKSESGSLRTTGAGPGGIKPIKSESGSLRTSETDPGGIKPIKDVDDDL